MSSWLRSSALVLLVALAPAWAADETIRITAVRQPVDKSYRDMVKGMDLFEQMHARAPKASLRYKLYPRKRDADMHIGQLSLVGETFESPIPVAADNTFTLARNRRALAQDAFVRSERKADTMTWRADVRTPGLPPDTRRLGDLRLECLVGVEAGLISQYPGLLSRFLKLLETPQSFCGRPDLVLYLFFAERPLFGVTLRSGDRVQSLSVGYLYAGIAHGNTPQADRRYCDCEALLDRAYNLPLADESWPDDTLVELEYMERAPAAGPYAMFVGSSKDEVRAALGPSSALRFDDYEVWAYDFGPADKPRLEREELLVLFDRRDVVVGVKNRTPGLSSSNTR